MAILTLEGRYEDGRIELEEQPVGIHKARVIVTFLPEAADSDDAATQRRRKARDRLLETMRRGISFGGEKINREAIYEERLIELEKRGD